MPKRPKIGFGMGKGALMRGGRGKVMLCGPDTKWGNPYPIANVGVYEDNLYAVERFRWAFKMGELGIDVTDVMTEMQCARWLVTKPAVDWDQLAAFLADEGLPGVPQSIRAGDDESAAIAEAAARICYMSYGRGRRDIAGFINNLLRSKDGGVFEHINYGFAFTGVSRSLTHELVRHRAGFAFSRRSQRYVDETGGSFVAPYAVAADQANAILQEALANAAQSYDALVDALAAVIPMDRFASATDHRKAIRQAASAVLPNAAETKIFVTANVRV